MIPDLDIWRAALLKVKRYGSNAAVQAARRTDELLEFRCRASWKGGS